MATVPVIPDTPSDEEVFAGLPDAVPEPTQANRDDWAAQLAGRPHAVGTDDEDLDDATTIPR